MAWLMVPSSSQSSSPPTRHAARQHGDRDIGLHQAFGQVMGGGLAVDRRGRQGGRPTSRTPCSEGPSPSFDPQRLGPVSRPGPASNPPRSW